MSTAEPIDVDPGVISTELDPEVVQGYIDDVAFDARQAIDDYDDWEEQRKRGLEKYAAALRIRELRDRAISSASRETASMDYEGSSIEALRTQVNRRDPSGTLAYNTDTDRYVGSAN